MSTTLRRSVAVLAVTALVIVLIAYAGSEAEPTAPEETPSPTPTPTPAASPAPSPRATSTPTPSPTPTETPEPTPTAEPASPAPRAIPTPRPGVPEVSLLVVVDKTRPLPEGYIPPNLAWLPREWLVPGWGDVLLRQEAIDALDRLLTAVRVEGLDIRIRSAYRSYEEQVGTFQHWINVYGEELARRRSAPPGHSEHQLGTTVDFTVADIGWELDEAFVDTPAGRWLAAHAHEYGFALSYPEGGEPVTGYMFEPWHYRFIGEGAARAWHASGLTLVEFLELLGE